MRCLQSSVPVPRTLFSPAMPRRTRRPPSNFTNAYQTMDRWRNQTDGSEVLLVGADNIPFPIPLTKNSAGQWSFDTAAGKDEILARRIGDNELAAIDVMAAMADAQAQYLAQRHDGVKQYAQKFISDEGKQDGLYWKSAGRTAEEPARSTSCVRLDRRIRPRRQASSSHFTATSIASSQNRAPTPRAARKITSSTGR